MNRELLEGLACALAAGLLWGLVFITPVLLPEYPAAMLSVGRYLAFGLLALPLALAGRTAIAALDRDDWSRALELALIGNLMYYGLLAAGIQLAGAPLPTMIIGTLPLVIAVVSNLSDRALRWRALALPLALIAAGLGLVNHDELARLAGEGRSPGSLAAGALLTVGAVACWTWYPIRNARWMKHRPALASGTWATAQGLATLPLALGGALLIALNPALGVPAMADASIAAAAVPPSGMVTATAPIAPIAGASPAWASAWLGPRPVVFVGAMLALGLLASWLGTRLWNRASRLLPTALSGQLIVFETLAALLYAFVLRGQWPSPATRAGIALLLVGVLAGVRATARG